MLTLVINLDRDSERLTLATSELSKVNLTPTRVSAIPGSALDHNESLMPNLNAAACWLSHVKSMQIFLESGFDLALICEDDLVIRNPKVFKRVLREASTLNNDITQLGFLTHGFLERLMNFRQWVISLRSSRSNYSRYIFVPDDFLAGAHCYLISRKGAKLLVSLNQPPSIAADGVMQGMVRAKSLQGMRTRKSYVDQRDGISRITNQFERR